MENSDALELSMLDELRSLGGEEDPGFFARLVDQFISEAAARVRGIQGAVERSDARALANCAHSLKGSAGSMGAVKLAARCAELEARSKSGTLEGTASLAGEVDYEYQRACAALLAQTGGPASRVASSGA